MPHGEGSPKKPMLQGKPEDMQTWGRWYPGDRSRYRFTNREHGYGADVWLTRKGKAPKERSQARYGRETEAGANDNGDATEERSAVKVARSVLKQRRGE